VVRGLERRLGALGRRWNPPPDPQFLAFARAVVGFGGEPDPGGESAEGLARWLAARGAKA
jgi:hypothetical protein